MRKNGLESICHIDLRFLRCVVKERYQYCDYGQVTILDAAGVVIPESVLGAAHFYTGRSVIMGTGLFDYRNRVMDPGMGRFRQRDPLEYIDSMNMYSYVNSNSFTHRDPLGRNITYAYEPADGSSGYLPYGSYSFEKSTKAHSLPVSHDSAMKWHYAKFLAQNPDRDLVSCLQDVLNENGGLIDGYRYEKNDLYHTNTSLDNIKVVDDDGYEYIFSPDIGRPLVTDDADGGTRNDVPPEDLWGHFKEDVWEYWKWGNTPCDPTPLLNRILGPRILERIPPVGDFGPRI